MQALKPNWKISKILAVSVHDLRVRRPENNVENTKKAMLSVPLGK